MSGLASVVREIVDKVLADDWQRTSTNDGSLWYYTVGLSAQDAEREGGHEFKSHWFPQEKPSSAPKPASVLGRWYTRSQLAATQEPLFDRALKRLQKAGIHTRTIAGILKGNRNDLAAVLEEPTGQAVQALLDLLQAARIDSAKGRINLDHDDLEEIEAAREKIYLKELAQKYERMLDRGRRLESLGFEDPQLHEASRCYLYGFHRATVVLSAAAAEQHLKRVTGLDRFERYSTLIDRALSMGLIDGALVEASTQIFAKRNAVMHGRREVSAQDAERVLDLARRVVDHLQEGEPAPDDRNASSRE